MSGDSKKLVARAERLTINREFDSVESLIREYVTNISTSGVFIKTENPLTVGTRVNLRFTVVADDLETIEGLGEVVRTESKGMGVVFVKLTKLSQTLVEQLITRRSREP